MPVWGGSRYRVSVLNRLCSSFVLGSLAVLSCLGAPGCQNYRDQLQRGQGYYEQNQYETALAVWRHLEADQASLTPTEVVRYCYLRGMTDYRLGYREDSRYWLGLAKAGEKKASGALLSEEVKRLDLTLEDLNVEVFDPSQAGRSREQALGDSCQWTSDCETGFACQEGVCIQSEVSSSAAGNATP